MLGSDSRVQIVSGHDDPNAYVLIARSDLPLSIASACYYGALGIGAPTLVIGLAGMRFSRKILSAGVNRFPSQMGSGAGCCFGQRLSPWIRAESTDSDCLT